MVVIHFSYLFEYMNLGRELFKDLFKQWSNLDESDFSLETVSGGITNLCAYIFVFQ